VFRLSRPTPAEFEGALRQARDLPDASPPLLTLAAGPVLPLPLAFAHDVSRSRLGAGERVLSAAKEAMRSWAEFDLGWVQVVNPAAPVKTGEYVAVLVYTAGLWSLNISRILETVDTPTRFGFLYSTTSQHVENGQERFLVELDEEQGSVTYFIEALSKPHHLLARLGSPFARAMQRRFARESHARMKEIVSAMP